MSSEDLNSGPYTCLARLLPLSHRLSLASLEIHLFICRLYPFFYLLLSPSFSNPWPGQSAVWRISFHLTTLSKAVSQSHHAWWWPNPRALGTLIFKGCIDWQQASLALLSCPPSLATLPFDLCHLACALTLQVRTKTKAYFWSFCYDRGSSILWLSWKIALVSSVPIALQNANQSAPGSYHLGDSGQVIHIL